MVIGASLLVKTGVIFGIVMVVEAGAFAQVSMHEKSEIITGGAVAAADVIASELMKLKHYCFTYIDQRFSSTLIM